MSEPSEVSERKDLAIDQVVGFVTPVGLVALVVYFAYATLIRQFGTECGVFSPFTRVAYQLVGLSVLISGCHMRVSRRCEKCGDGERALWSLVRVGSLGAFFYLAFRLLESYADGNPLVDNRVVDGGILLMWALVAVMGQKPKSALAT